ncbi:SDR family NAD(P)-dependent oxidoreductase [Cryobacterium breve]|jgi:3-oxoacyl-[acyl-carrier protein] reductase|uniref:SDR family NAD(P)-dependent oxidoreductase n=1 Tax=Cryobacterium breve TaxID=1259258 RepID=A0ABY7N9H1_9MICO|nr:MULTISPECIES: SDR family NAD(P)-dependent oxidoreductase [Cryobacterium]MDY7542281.1 SDR family NAD(P)-dependent oxidoreductase [Cryobacterium sp. 5B3]MEB0276467.1 SDR family NAD(P)-dependent oxidoreductase [Cryobacterium sp. 5B3]WBM79159.1 SDR family NAD(P)-dependent oxidoreductase [Cryobacterium breve]
MIEAADAARGFVAGRTVLVAGATSTAGRAVSAALAGAGARVIVVGSNAQRLSEVVDGVPGAIPFTCDLADVVAVTDLAERVHADLGMIDGLIHLVGGWRGGGGLAGQSDEDWAFLHRNIVSTLRNTTRSFNADLLASPAGRLAIVSSVSVEAPTPGGANYAAAKSAAETWTRAVGHGFAKAAPPSGQTAATAIFVVRALDGLEPELADRVVALWDVPAASVTNTRIPLG